MRISRIYNNNVALATNFAGEETVVIGRGLAFGKRKGDMIDPTRVEQTFVPEKNTSEERLSWSLSEIPAEILSLAIELESQVRDSKEFSVSHSFVIPLADHLNFALIRAREGIAVDYPLAVEVSQLYPKEVEFGRRAVALVSERLGVDLPDQEAIPLALHLVNSQFAASDMSQTFRMTEVFAQIFELISSFYGVEIDQSALSAARFVTHLRYLFVRTGKEGAGSYQDDATPLLTEAVKASYPQAFACAQKVYLLLEMQLNQELTDDELTYLTIHIARLAKDLGLEK
ncbi:PRD domain-containing protein [Rothia aerolata]|uniref:Transcription antiterminator BglG n=1 Tax=Rothia aerolata TaxID=1812262 RepID=A0A917MXA0_9MICC|nr:PRD domain-containing protein [Rothia aerolata]GGH66343.1 transcription antiterminator BglG [Rothia aerolata]